MNDSVSRSCCGCKFLFGDGQGYSDYTWENTDVTCTLGLNPNLPESEPFDWDRNNDQWSATMAGRCERFSPGPYITISPDGEPDQDPVDAEQAQSIKASRDWMPDGTWARFDEGAKE